MGGSLHCVGASCAEGGQMAPLNYPTALGRYSLDVLELREAPALSCPGDRLAIMGWLPVDVRSTPEAVADGAQFRRRSLSLTRSAGRTMITPNLTAAHGENQHEGTFDDEGHSRPQPRVTVVD